MLKPCPSFVTFSFCKGSLWHLEKVHNDMIIHQEYMNNCDQSKKKNITSTCRPLLKNPITPSGVSHTHANSYLCMTYTHTITAFKEEALTEERQIMHKCFEYRRTSKHKSICPRSFCLCSCFFIPAV